MELTKPEFRSSPQIGLIQGEDSLLFRPNRFLEFEVYANGRIYEEQINSLFDFGIQDPAKRFDAYRSIQDWLDKIPATSDRNEISLVRRQGNKSPIRTILTYSSSRDALSDPNMFIVVDPYALTQRVTSDPAGRFGIITWFEEKDGVVVEKGEIHQMRADSLETLNQSISRRLTISNPEQQRELLARFREQTVGFADEYANASSAAAGQ